MKMSDVGANWFDLVVLVVIALGILRGRSRGMSVELLDVLKWLMVVVVGGLIYRPCGLYVAAYTHISPMLGFVVSYLAVLLLVRFFFSWAKRMVGEKLVGSDVFGSWEYYLGMIAGAVRYTCMLVVALALLNAKYISPEQLAAQARMQRENFEDISFPTLGTVQQTVFVGSASGKIVKRYLGHELIVATAADCRSGSADTIGRQRERAVSEILGDGRSPSPAQ